MGQFNTVRGSNGQVKVWGTDQFGIEGSAVVNSREWDAVKAEAQAVAQWQADTTAFDEAVTKDLENIHKVLDEINSRPAPEQAVNPLATITIREPVDGEDGKPGDPGDVRELSPDSQVLRAIEEGKDDLLFWLDDHTLDIVDSATPAATTPVEADVTADA